MLTDINIMYIQDKIEVGISIIKAIFLALLIYYTNFKITNKKANINSRKLYNVICIIIISIICEIIKHKANYLIGVISSILLISIIFSKENMGIVNCIITTILSFSINYVALCIVICISFIINIVMKIDNNYINASIMIIGHIIIIASLWKIKKFKYGFSFLQNKEQNEYIDILILNTSVVFIFLIILLSNCNIVLARDLGSGIIISIIIMFLTIQKSLQLYYKQKLLVQELDQTKQELANKTKEVEDLEAENIKISKNAHTLSHKQKSLEYKIEEMINKTEISKEEAAEVRDRLKEIGKDLYKEKTTIELDKTGIEQIDDMLKYMQSECKKNKIDFELQLKGNIHYMTNNFITKEDLETLLADHIKNAIIAINHTDNINRSILVRLGKIDETYGLYIYDSGIEFEPETLENLGKKPSTTHANEGGTGMGFMNTFDTLRKCNASLIIEEYNEPSKDNYTKALLIKFDNKNAFKIKSYRTL